MADTTPLLDFLRKATPEQRARCARLAKTSVAYLYQIAGCERPNIGARTALAIEDATRALHTETEGGLPVITVRTLSTMCVACARG